MLKSQRTPSMQQKFSQQIPVRIARDAALTIAENFYEICGLTASSRRQGDTSLDCNMAAHTRIYGIKPIPSITRGSVTYHHTRPAMPLTLNQLQVSHEKL
jgi:hypothetical protein